MLNLALVGLLAGSLVSTAPDGDKDKDRSQAAPTPAATEAAATPAVPQVRLGLVPAADETADPRSIINDTYAFGRDAAEAPIKIWVSFGHGQVEQVFDFQGESQIINLGGTVGNISTTRVDVGAQINLINFTNLRFGLGAQLGIARLQFNPESDPGGGAFPDGLVSDFGLQNVKVYGLLRGRVVGIHGGYIFDLASAETFDDDGEGGQGLPTNLTTTDGRDAIFFGADFDYPCERIRLFGGLDYFKIASSDEVLFTDGQNEGDDVLQFTTGLGLRFGMFEIGAALLIHAQLKDGPLTPSTGAGTLVMGGHYGSIAPYLRVSPTFIPASLFIRGAVSNEYVDYGFPIGGANDFKPQWGFTAGITAGFN